MSMVHQHRTYDRLRAAVPGWVANRASPFTAIAVGSQPTLSRRDGCQCDIPARYRS
jgi:hypothetical protein